jgi:hypothetical protein
MLFMSRERRIEKLTEAEFKRLIGVKRDTYKYMLSEWKEHRKKLRKGFGIGGRKRALTEGEEVLVMLQYYREYRTYEQIGLDYGVSEPTARKTVKDVEKLLIKSNKFALPKRRDLYSNSETESLLIDVTEIQIQRPKKSKNNTTQARKNSIQ